MKLLHTPMQPQVLHCKECGGSSTAAAWRLRNATWHLNEQLTKAHYRTSRQHSARPYIGLGQAASIVNKPVKQQQRAAATATWSGTRSGRSQQLQHWGAQHLVGQSDEHAAGAAVRSCCQHIQRVLSQLHEPGVHCWLMLRATSLFQQAKHFQVKLSGVGAAVAAETQTPVRYIPPHKNSSSCCSLASQLVIAALKSVHLLRK